MQEALLEVHLFLCGKSWGVSNIPSSTNPVQDGKLTLARSSTMMRTIARWVEAFCSEFKVSKKEFPQKNIHISPFYIRSKHLTQKYIKRNIERFSLFERAFCPHFKNILRLSSMLKYFLQTQTKLKGMPFLMFMLK